MWTDKTVYDRLDKGERRVADLETWFEAAATKEDVKALSERIFRLESSTTSPSSVIERIESAERRLKDLHDHLFEVSEVTGKEKLTPQGRRLLLRGRGRR